MAASTGLHSYGTTLGLDTSGATTFVTVAEVKKITGPGVKVGSSERTNLNSPNAVKEFVSALIDAGELTFTLNFTQAEYAILLGALRKNLMSFKITFPLLPAGLTGATVVFHGHITDLGQEIPEDDIITNDVTVKVSDLPVFTAGT